MTVKDIVREYLADHGYDGLYNAELDCACLTDDLGPCDDWRADCCPGYKTTCQAEGCQPWDRCECCIIGGWHVQAEPPKGGR